MGHPVFLRAANNEHYTPVLVYRVNDFSGWVWLDFWSDEEYLAVNFLTEWAYAKEVIDQS